LSWSDEPEGKGECVVEPTWNLGYDAQPMHGDRRRAALLRAAEPRLRRFRGDGTHPEPSRRQRVIAPMPVVFAAGALLLDVGNLAAGGELAVMTRDAPARE
jgi:hypothetical protein